MNSLNKMVAALAVALGGALVISPHAMANGGPFLIKYPNGDPAARGIPARLDPSLKPTREERLRVVKEDLTISFVPNPSRTKRVTRRPAVAPAPSPKAPLRPSPAPEPAAEAVKTPGKQVNASLAPAAAEVEPVKPAPDSPPLAVVTAAYMIENPTAESIEIDFGFPILRGIYLNRFSMMPTPDVRVRLDTNHISTEIISNSDIYGLIRQRARDAIEMAVASDAELARLVATVRATGMVRQRAREAINETVGKDAALSKAVATDGQLAPLAASLSSVSDPEHDAARTALAAYLKQNMKWEPADIALMVEFASIDFRTPVSRPRDREKDLYIWLSSSRHEPATANLGALAAIGEQKATQFFARLAACFNPAEAAAYEDIFSAWGGDVRERSLDLLTGDVRPREITVTPEALDAAPNPFEGRPLDPTIYARVDYLDPKANLSPKDKASCENVLKNLPVVFTFSPMNLIYYRVKFPANSTETLTVSYRQFAYTDTKGPASYQLAYVVHPASMWKEFGPINLEIAVPENVPVRASTAIRQAGVEEREPMKDLPSPRSDQKKRFAIHRGTVADKTGELYIAIDSNAWSKVTDEETSKQDADRQASR